MPWWGVAIVAAIAFGAGGALVAYVIGTRTDEAYMRGYRAALQWLEDDDA